MPCVFEHATHGPGSKAALRVIPENSAIPEMEKINRNSEAALELPPPAFRDGNLARSLRPYHPALPESPLGKGGAEGARQVRSALASVDTLACEHAPLRTDGSQIEPEPGAEDLAGSRRTEVLVHGSKPTPTKHGGDDHDA